MVVMAERTKACYLTRFYASHLFAPPAAAEDPSLGGLAVAEVPGSYEVGELHTGADQAVQAPSSAGSPSAAGRASAP